MGDIELRMPAGVGVVTLPADSPLVAKYRGDGWTLVEPEAPEPKTKAPARKPATHR